MTTPREIFVSNTLTRKKEKLETVEPGVVRMYACGVTTYDYCHVGHALQAVFFDIIRRYLRYAGYQVIYVRNHTDVDDKIIARAKERGMKPSELSDIMVKAAEEDMAALGVEAADHEPRVSQMIPQIIAMIVKLIENGAAYETAEGDVYYRVRDKQDYGKLSGRKVEDMRSGTRALVSGDKEFELDFALWKKDDTEGASWQSPWSLGRPGWHIECSAMAKDFLGATFDIHGGGRDLVFPHHENEIAQSESANAAPFATYWLHNGLMTIDGQKMSKSLGNHLLIRDALKKWPSEVLRMSIVSQHYSSNVDFTEQGFKIWFQRLYYYYSSLAALDEAAKDAPEKAKILEDYDPQALRDGIHKALSDDFNTSAAIAEFNVQLRNANTLLTAKLDKNRKRYTAQQWCIVIREIGGILGILYEEPQAALDRLRDIMLPQLGIQRSEIETQLQQRIEAREQKDFTESDRIRDALLASGIEVMDSPQGTTWRIKPQPAE